MAKYKDIVGTAIRNNAGNLPAPETGQIWFDSTNVDFKYQQPNKTYNGKHNAAFAIIPVGGTVDYIPGDSIISGTFNSIPPVPRIKKLKFKFRWHDGSLVVFNNCNVNIVIQLQELINNIAQQPMITNINSLAF